MRPGVVSAGYTANMRPRSTDDVASRIRIRRAHAADAAVLSEFAERIFRETFEAANNPADLAAYLADAFGVDLQRAEILTSSSTVLLAEDVTGSNAVTPLAGYSHLATGESPHSVHGPAPVELKRFYIDSAWQGTGLAQVLMRATIDAALASGAATIWLGVWEHNPRAIAFYRKWKFGIVGSHVFLMGDEELNDFWMARELHQ